MNRFAGPLGVTDAERIRAHFYSESTNERRAAEHEALLALLAGVRADERRRIAREIDSGEFTGHNTSGDDLDAIAEHVRTLPTDWAFSGFGAYPEFK